MGTHRRSAPRAAAVRLGALAIALLAFFLLRYPVRGFRVPMGPDAPVYMWWANLARIQGLSVANWRPGMPALSLMLGGSTGLSQLEITAGMGAAIAAAIGLAAAALARRPDRPLWVSLTTGALAGTFAVHLAGGYLANIVFAALFVAVLAMLSRAVESPAAVASTALLLGAGGLAHPLFLVVGVAVLLVSIPLIDIEDRTAVWLTATGGVAITGIGLLAMFAGPRPLHVDTSSDAFLRRAGFGAELRGEFLDRLGHHWARYVPWLLLPLAWFGRREEKGTTLRLLDAFALVCIGGLAASFFVQKIPGVRVIAFAYALPILAGLGLLRARKGLTNRLLGVLVAASLAGIMIAGSALTWFRERPYATPDAVSQIRAAGAVAGGAPAGTPLIFVVDETDPDLVGFRVTNAGNLIRAYLPAAMIPEIHLFVGWPGDLLNGRPSRNGTALHDALSRLYLQDLQEAGVSPQESKPIVFVLGAFNPKGRAVAGEFLRNVAPGVAAGYSPQTSALPAAAAATPAPWILVLAGVLIFVLLCVAGYGWALWATGDGFMSAALSPAFGAASLILAGVIMDRAGIRLGGAAPPVATALAGLCGYLLAWRKRLERRPIVEPATQINEQPD